MSRNLSIADFNINWDHKLIVTGLSVVVLATTGPFGTYESLSLLPRFAYWAAAVIGVGLVMNLLALFSLRVSFIWKQPWYMRMLIWVIVGAVPGTLIMSSLGVIFLGHDTLLHVPIHRLYFKLCVISTAIALVDLRPFAMVHTPVSVPPEQMDPPVIVSPDQARIRQFLNQLKPDLGNDVISISIQDHYLDVTTTQGSDLIHGRLSDAAEKLESLPGVRLHRSHWAAVAHIQRLHRQGTGHVACLSDGRELPVSRSQLPDVRSALGLS
ncbi:LytTR family DNA-binding domain-containing protein [Halocynthiibacter sp.]|uniref:LytTR family DNA-binding domain-containing protein n=1 Tax=Halocynthiibacter sp. TaxID=1979210 RepID=UPI003C48CDF9